MTETGISISNKKNLPKLLKWLGRGICGSFFLSLSFSCSQVVNFLKWKNHYLSKNITIFHSNDDFFTQYLFLNEKKVSFDDFFMTIWERENESERKK